MKKQIVIGILGVKLDRAFSDDPWAGWRPTVSLCQHEELLIDRLELLVDAKNQDLADSVTADIGKVSPETTVRHHHFGIDNPWDFEQAYAALHDFSTRYFFNIDKEDYFVHITTGTHVCQICLFLLTESRHIPGKLLQSSPPKRQKRNKPGEYAIINLDLSRYDRLAARHKLEVKEHLTYLKSGIATRSPEFNKLIIEIESVAIYSKSPIVLMGPTGAGKSRLARRVFELKRARGQVAGEFIEINCGTLRGDAAMSALFGHVKGAFTGALTDRLGLLKTADRGILFLDEVGELGLDEQAMLLRALEDKSFFPMGSDTTTQSDFQLISGTNRDLIQDVHSGKFRADLFSRINLWVYKLPGLSERREDIEPNLDYELQLFAQNHGRIARFNKEARARYLRFAMSPEAYWKGNFRDLNASVTRMTTLSRGHRIDEANVDTEIRRLQVLWKDGDGQDQQWQGLLEDVLGRDKIDGQDLFDKLQLAQVIRVCRECKTMSAAGRRLFAASRLQKKTANDADRLKKYLAKFDLTWDQIIS